MNSPTMNAPVAPQNPQPAGSKKTLTLVLGLIGALVILGVIATSAWRASHSLSSSNTTQSLNTEGIAELDVEVDAGKFNILFAEVPTATLDVQSSRSGEWKLQRDGSSLLVRSPNDWGDWCFTGCDWDENEVTLTLPNSLNSGELDAVLKMSAGEYSVDGNFNDLIMEMSGGTLEAAGAANGLFVELGAGKTDIDMADVQAANFNVSAGRIDSTLTGSSPNNVQADVSAGMLNLTLPKDSYNVSEDISAGSLDNSLLVDSSSPHMVKVEVSAGNVVLRPGAEATTPKK
ncbi:hypothetical protein CQ010_06135 [Arthrobacter sp. MYb211]|uniref:DUF4097 family beta strand repeat-containing protein n=1 Tax=unclassified Arthrobacter TaxID=235627 RepID=UPI000CFCA40F|nr:MULTISPECIES: DUF4097 family beta strand repeat-containing protein [unclassified Arthrobacter]PRA12228.1 hypothetical protein CQ015_06830 [Arthrobacter sp. MYb221]PRC08690.1 hypothetical protein CQ010_06135 [Arthrobacter sp. MYb211]